MGFLKKETYPRLAALIDLEVLDTLKERKDKFITKLFDHKLQLLLSENQKKLQVCIYCRELFTFETHPHISCQKNPDFIIDETGQYIALHKADPDFNVKNFINFVKEKY